MVNLKSLVTLQWQLRWPGRRPHGISQAYLALKDLSVGALRYGAKHSGSHLNAACIYCNVYTIKLGALPVLIQPDCCIESCVNLTESWKESGLLSKINVVYT
jgi:hypothetical protein